MSDSRRAPDVDYLTRDYEGFRRLLVSLLDRSPTPWTERAAADLGITLVEILANQLDHLAYAGDRIAAEAFLPTARRREYARRHAALGDHRLDRGNATAGFQRFQVAPGERFELSAGALLGQPLAHGDDPASRPHFETTAPARLDAGTNELTLARSAAAGETWLRLRAQGGSRLDVRSVGLRPGTHLCIVDSRRGGGEFLTVKRAQGDAVELTAPLGETYLADTRVLGNLAPIRRGRTSDWEPVGHGGAKRDELPATQYFAARLAEIRRLRAEVEAARSKWIDDRSLAAWWELACAEVACVVRELRASAGNFSKEQPEQLKARLRRAARLLRDLLRNCSLVEPVPLQTDECVALPGQTIALPGPAHTLWCDGAETLHVRVETDKRSTQWQERDDLLRSGPDDPHYVVELDDAGTVTLRFGDGVNGAILPPNAAVTVRRTRGDLFAGDIDASTFTELLEHKCRDPQTGAPIPPGERVVATENPLPTAGARKPEALRGDLVRNVRLGLARRAIPVTADDYRTVLLQQIADIVEVSVVAGERVDVVIRVRPGAPPAPVLARAREFLRTARLVGTDVWVRLCEPLFVSITLVVEVHPEMSAADVRLRVRRSLLSSFGGGAADELGRPRTCAEVYSVVESVAGVVYSQVLGFDLACLPAAGLGVNQEIRPARHQVVRCLGLPDNPQCGDITMWTARRYRLQVELACPDPDEQPDPEAILAMIHTSLSGPDSLPVAKQWPALTAARIDDMFARNRPNGATYRLSVRALTIGERAVDQVLLGDGELPVLDGVQLRDRLFKPHFDLELTPAAAGLESRIRELLSGPDATPVREGWAELTPRLIRGALARGLQIDVQRVRLRIGGYDVRQIPLERGDVPVLDTLFIEGADR